MEDGKLAYVAKDAHADLIVVDGDLLSDIGLLAADGYCLNLITRAGTIGKSWH